jgi:hypothetical protein
MKNEHRSYSLTRSGNSPVKFTGRLIAEEIDVPAEPRAGKTDCRRWHFIHLYETKTGKLILYIHFLTAFPGETQQHTVFVCDTMQDVQDHLIGDEGYDPCQYLEGFPDIPKFEKHQSVLEDRIVTDFDSRVGRLLSKTGVAEVID